MIFLPENDTGFMNQHIPGRDMFLKIPGRICFEIPRIFLTIADKKFNVTNITYKPNLCHLGG